MTRSGARLGLLATHPVQYQVPWYRALANTPGVDLTVFYCMLPDAHQQGTGFGVDFRWDVPMLEGYSHRVLPNVARSPALGRFGGCNTPAIRGVLQANTFDAFIISGWGVRSYLQALWACRRAGVPVILRGESNGLKPRPWYIRLVHRMLLSQCSAMLAIGTANAAFYAQNGVPEERIFHGPYCVDNARFEQIARTLAPERPMLREGWHIPPGACVFLYCGKFVEKKRPLDLLRAFTLVHRELPGQTAHLLMVGDGPLRAECEQFTREAGLPVSFAGFLNQAEIPKAYVASDCLVLPSDYGETWGLVVNEAMACGRPAIVSDRVGCHPDLVVPGKTGAVFPFKNTEALADVLTELTKRPDRRQEMGKTARDLVASFNVDTLLSGTLKALRYVATRPRATVVALQ